jgi:DNA-binding response OmpR family regulator
MRVLVVDDDPTAQKIMRLFLEKSGYKPEIRSDGKDIMQLAESEDPPQIYILDWLLPGKDGLTLCKELRTAHLKTRPYIFLFSSRNSGQDIVTALDAGADDFISKPFNVIETQARLRVASRLIEYQGELLQQLSDNEALMQRNNLLGEIIHRKTGGRTPALIATKAKVQSAKPTAKIVEGNPANFGLQEVRFLLSSSLLELQLAVQSLQLQSRPSANNDLHWCAWSSIVVPSHGLWVDIVLDALPDEVLGLFKKSVGRPPENQTEKSVYFAEIARIIGGSFARTLSCRAGSAIQPLMPRAKLTDMHSLPNQIDIKRFDLLVDGLMLGLTLSLSPSASLRLSPEETQEFDILAEPFPPSQFSGIPLLMEGVTLTPRFIEKMRQIAETSSDSMQVACFRPSGLARFFNGYKV